MSWSLLCIFLGHRWSRWTVKDEGLGNIGVFQTMTGAHSSYSVLQRRECRRCSRVEVRRSVA